MNSIEEFYNKLYGLSYTTRYSTIPRIKDESVAEHSFYVASIVIRLAEDYKFDVGTSVAMAIVHDWPEAWTGDILVTVKRSYPEIAKAVMEAEDNIVNYAFPPFAKAIFKEYNKFDNVEAHIVHLADVIQCIQYAKHEIELGNSGYMRDVLDMAERRKNNLELILDEFKRTK